ncbi:TRAP transporter substrate-binding protein [Roseobacter sp. HKCCA0434]|uniref:TRAP transporter substrate-binding protein n=1 Tax=Roseobacter sp. HKCCA0434 TaxID=3079297 RepID=UPI002905BDF9|nr:TRAP transporter substrate-binding protein [Roseobacter sp. HKCCA0434]
MFKPLLYTLSLLALPAAAETWIMATPYGDGLFQTQNVRDFAEMVEERSDGALVIEVHSNASLYEHGAIDDAVAGGEIEAGEVLLSVLSSDAAAYGLDTLPFSATDYDGAAELWDAQRPLVEALLEARGLMPLYSVPWPPQGLYTREEITDPAELRGRALRTYNATMDVLAEELDMSAVRVEVKDIPVAIAAGELDMMLTSATTGVGSASWDYFPYFYDIQAWLPKNMVFVNRAAFDALSPEVQRIVLDAAAEAEAEGTISSMIDAVEAVKTLFDNGTTIVTSDGETIETRDGRSVRSVDPMLLQALEAASARVAQRWLEDAGSEADLARVLQTMGAGG